ncbi:DUF481 domain-containing protein [Halioglobus maricola]|uniref:DUF481 domain-containing protein n=1 Tax=Halioglobus maricola TaxID=2601894 RepID=A0A5P9NK84_9GAMM|nr:DUF481 domain-containing protein [Halioglobus maricola]QFU75654.1 DUF481 domain-containing protein [Halioglobus maricola]
MTPSHHFIRILALIFCLIGTEALAQRKTDVVHLYNGDKVTGEIKQLYGGILELSTDSMGRVRIEWPEVARVESKYHYEVRVSDGERLYGSFSNEARPGQLLLTDIFGRHELESLGVVEIRPVEETFIDRLDVYLSGTYGYTNASGVTQLAFNTEVSYEDEKSRNTLSARSEITETDEGSTSSTRINVNRGVWRLNRSDAFRTTFVNYEDNDELDLAYRIGVGAGLGRYVLDSHRTRLVGSGGLQVITEKNLGAETNQDVEAFFNLTYATWKFTTPELNVDLNFTLYPSVTDLGRLRSDSSLRLRWEMIEDLSWDITAWATSDNQVEDSDSYWDYSITTGIGWEF